MESCVALTLGMNGSLLLFSKEPGEWFSLVSLQPAMQPLHREFIVLEAMAFNRGYVKIGNTA